MPLEADFFIRAGDRWPPITATLTDAAGAGIDLTNCTVHFRMTPIAGGAPTVDALATIPTPATGAVLYAWAAGDTDAPGYYRSAWVVTYPSGEVMSVPNTGDSLVLVSAAV